MNNIDLLKFINVNKMAIFFNGNCTNNCNYCFYKYTLNHYKIDNNFVDNVIHYINDKSVTDIELIGQPFANWELVRNLILSINNEINISITGNTDDLTDEQIDFINAHNIELISCDYNYKNNILNYNLVKKLNKINKLSMLLHTGIGSIQFITAHRVIVKSYHNLCGIYKLFSSKLTNSIKNISMFKLNKNTYKLLKSNNIKIQPNEIKGIYRIGIAICTDSTIRNLMNGHILGSVPNGLNINVLRAELKLSACTFDDCEYYNICKFNKKLWVVNSRPCNSFYKYINRCKNI